MSLGTALMNLKRELEVAEQNFKNGFEEGMDMIERGLFLNIQLDLHILRQSVLRNEVYVQNRKCSKTKHLTKLQEVNNAEEKLQESTEEADEESTKGTGSEAEEV